MPIDRPIAIGKNLPVADRVQNGTVNTYTQLDAGPGARILRVAAVRGLRLDPSPREARR
jgi:hypothetical protein